MTTTSDETKKDEKKEVIEYPNIVERFREVFQKLGIKKSGAYVDHCAKGDLEDLEDIEQKLYEMGLHPSLRNQVINFWASDIKKPVPKKLQKRLAEERGTKAREGNEGKGEAEKYSVDTETGAIKVASTTDKRALTWDEAEKLSKEIKKDIDAKERESGGKEPAFILGEQGAWSLNPKAKIGFGEFAVFQMYQDSLKKGEPIDPVEELARREEASVRLKEAMGVKGEDTEMTTLDKLDKLGMLKKSEGGEGALLSQLESLGLLRKPGEEGRDTQIDMLDKLDKLGMLKKSEGGEGALLSQLDSLGLLRKPGEEGKDTQIDMLEKLDQLGLVKKTGEEGRATQIDMLEKLDQLGLLKKTGEGDAASQTITGLQTEVKALRESLQKQEMDTLKNVVVSLSNQMSELRKTMSNQGKLEGRFALMDKTIGAVDSQLTGIRSDVKPLLTSLGSGGGAEPRKKSPEEKAAIAKGLKGAVALEKEAKALEDELLFGSTPQS